MSAPLTSDEQAAYDAAGSRAVAQMRSKTSERACFRALIEYEKATFGFAAEMIVKSEGAPATVSAGGLNSPHLSAQVTPEWQILYDAWRHAHKECFR